jgi:hypothetical protein
MLTFFEYVAKKDFYESLVPEFGQSRFDCQENLENLFLWYSQNLDKKQEFYERLDKNIRNCFKHNLAAYQKPMVDKNIVDSENVINSTLIRIHNTVEEKIKTGDLNYKTISGLVSTMIRRSVIDIMRSDTRAKRKGVLGFNTVGTDREPRSLAGDPSLEKFGLDDLLRVPNLNPRQKIILTRRSEGAKNQDIAAELNLRPPYTTILYNDAKDKIRKYYGIDAYTGNSEEEY